MHKINDLPVNFESWNGISMIFIPIPLVTCGGCKEVCNTRLKYKRLDVIMKHVEKWDDDSALKYPYDLLGKNIKQTIY